MRESTRTWLVVVGAMTVSLGIAACSSQPREEDVAASDAAAQGSDQGALPEVAGQPAESEGEGEHARSEGEGEHARGEGGGEEGEHGSSGEEGEESGEHIGRSETWDKTRRGARLVLSFDSESNAFVGTVENTTQQTLCAVRVEVHLSTGTELGPTERTDVAAGEKTAVELPTAGETFDTWTAHPEVSPCAGG